jgi:hypothetical protein
VKRRELLQRIQRAARAAGVDMELYELARHTGIRVGGISTTVPRHGEIPDRLAEVIFKQVEPVLGKGWWRN